MGKIKVRLAKAHERQEQDFEIKKELKSVQKYIDESNLEMKESGIAFVFLRGVYDNFTKKMTSAVLFINNTSKVINELHGVLDMKVCDNGSAIKVAKVTINFKEEFMGELKENEAMLVHFNIPIIGMNERRVFHAKDLSCQFTQVRVTYKEENVDEKN